MKNWYLTDDDCLQYMRNDGTFYEMIECVWLDTTEEDRRNGCAEYVVVVNEVDMDNIYSEEIECYISSYGYTLETLYKEYTEEEARDLIAECILEDVYDGNIIAEFKTFEEAETFIKEYIKNH